MPIISDIKRGANHLLTGREDPPMDPLVAAYGRDLGPRTTDAVNGVIAELGGHAISRRNLTDRIYSFAEGTALAIRFEEKIYDSSDAYVTEAPIRRVAAEKLRAIGCGRKVAYLETSGLMEVGGGYMAGMPLAVFPYGGVGFGYGSTASVLLRYRTSSPLFIGFGECTSTNLSHRRVRFPTDAESAMRMQPGSEVELTGQGRVSTSAGVSVSVGLALPMVATAGLGAVVGGGISLTDEYSLTILALDKPGMVRVTIRNLDEETAGIMARIRVGLNFSPGGVTGTIAGGFLRYYFEKTASSFEDVVNMYTTLNATISAGVTHRGLTIGSWDLDLNKPEAKQVYRDLINLNTIVAEELARSQSSAVKQTKAQESEVECRFGADVGMLGQKLLIYEVLQTERAGRLDRASGQPYIYRDSIYTRRKRNILFGTKEIKWEAANFRNGENGDNQPSLHLHFRHSDYDFGNDEIDRLLRFAEALNIPHAEIIGEDVQQLDEVTQRLKKLREVTMTTDIYFTKKGIENIDGADAAKAKNVYLKVSSIARKRFRGFDLTATDERTKKAVAIIAEYLALTGIENLSKATQRLKVLPTLRKAYFQLTARKLEVDAKLMRQADEFGAIVESLNDTRSADQVKSLFHSLGRRRGFEYMQTIAALAELAGPEETLVNELSISGGGVTIKNISEGALHHPREAVAAELYRVAD